MDESISKQNYEDLITHLYRIIKQMILDKALLPGNKIRQEQLAQQLGVSRTPVIKALQYLSKDNLVEYIPRRGFYVKQLDLEEMLNIFDVREVVEGVSAKTIAEFGSDQEIASLKVIFLPFLNNLWDEQTKLAYKEADHQFHLCLVELSTNKLLFKVVEMFNIYTFSYQKGLFRHPSETLLEHLRIIDAIEKRDSLMAQNLAILHIENSKKNIARCYLKQGKNIGEIRW